MVAIPILKICTQSCNVSILRIFSKFRVKIFFFLERIRNRIFTSRIENTTKMSRRNEWTNLVKDDIRIEKVFPSWADVAEKHLVKK